jgi:protein-tyrosine phosphatase
VAAIADAPPGAVLVHCAGGKDRTGAIVAVVLSFLGVGDDEIADDYALTSLSLDPIITEWLDSQSSDPAERERLRALAMPSREAMLQTLAHHRERYGSAEAYLRGGGVTDEQLARLRGRLLEPAAAP